MKKSILLTFLILIFLPFTHSEAQTVKSKNFISGRVVDKLSKEPIADALVSICVPEEKQVVQSAVTDADGFYVLDHLKNQTYSLTVRMMGYENLQEFERTPQEKPQEDIFLTPQYTQLSTVVISPDITSIKTLLGLRVVSVGADLKTSGNAAKDLMNNLPSSTVDIKGDMMLRGSTNIRFYVDGRPTNLNSKELLNVLPTSGIEKVELITNPSSKEYSDGPSGIVNIITSKSSKKGFGGAIDLSAGTADKYNAGVRLNYRTDKVNIWGGYAFFQNKNKLEGLVEKTDILPAESSATSTLSRQVVGGHYNGNDHEIKYGIDYDINTSTRLSYIGATRIIWRESNMNIQSDTYTDLSESKTTSGYLSNALSTSYMTFITNGVHFRHNFDNKNRLDADVNYEIDNTGNNTYFGQSFTTKMSPYMPDSVIDTSGYKSDYTYLTARLDYTNQGTKYKFEAGVNASLRTMDNPYHDKSITVMPSPRPQVTSLSSYHFRFNEDIFSIYSTYSRTFGALTAKIGIRMDVSKTKVKNLATTDGSEDVTYAKDTVNFYPSANLTYKIDQQNSLMLSYSRRVARPLTNQLNPNAVSTNPSRPNIGNPYLRPEYSNSLELTYLGAFSKINISSSLYWNQNRNVIQSYLTSVNPITGESTAGIIYNTFKNYDKAHTIGAEVIISAEATSWLNISGSANAYYVDYAIGENTYWNKCGVNYTTKLSATANVTKYLSVMLLGRYNGTQTHIQGIEDANSGMDAGVRYDFLQKKLSVSARVTDVFKSYQSRTLSVIDAGSGKFQNELDVEKYDTRVFYLSASYRF
ncbi:MAG: TonB-dependent receptor [Flavobacteriales bacterium]|nr:TonB-dependent receptor [Flavobacteriales bacterium]